MTTEDTLRQRIAQKISPFFGRRFKPAEEREEKPRELTKWEVTEACRSATKDCAEDPAKNYRSSVTAWAIHGMLSPCPEDTVDNSAPVATKRMRLSAPAVILLYR